MLLHCTFSLAPVNVTGMKTQLVLGTGSPSGSVAVRIGPIKQLYPTLVSFVYFMFVHWFIGECFNLLDFLCQLQSITLIQSSTI